MVKLLLWEIFFCEFWLVSNMDVFRWLRTCDFITSFVLDYSRYISILHIFKYLSFLKVYGVHLFMRSWCVSLPVPKEILMRRRGGCSFASTATTSIAVSRANCSRMARKAVLKLDNKASKQKEKPKTACGTSKNHITHCIYHCVSVLITAPWHFFFAKKQSLLQGSAVVYLR